MTASEEELPTERRPRAVVHTALVLLLLVLGSGAYFVQGLGANQNSRFDLVRALVERGSVSIDGYATNTSDRAVRDGHYYADKAPGLSFAAVPVYAAVRAVGWPHLERQQDVLHVVTVVVVGVTTAVAAAALFLVLVSMTIERRWAILAVVGWTLGTNGFGYDTLFLAHQYVGALLVLSFGLLHGCRVDHGLGRRWAVPLAGALGAWAAVSEYPAAVAGVLLFGYGAVALGWRRMVPFALAACAPVLLLFVYDAVAFGSPFSLGYRLLEERSFKEGMDRGFFGVGLPDASVLFKILLSESRGLFVLSPFLVLAIPGAIAMSRVKSLRLEASLMIATTTYFLLLNASYFLWSGGASMGPRHVVPMLPFMATLAAFGAQRASRLPRCGSLARLGSVLLVVFSVGVCTMTVAVMPELPERGLLRSPGDDLARPDMDHPLSTFIVPFFVHGLLGVKGVLPTGQVGLAFTAPGHDRDAYNLGEAMGLRGLASLLPLGFVWLIAGVALARTERTRAT